MKLGIILLMLTGPALAQDQLLGPGLWYDTTTGILRTDKFGDTSNATDANNLLTKLNALSKLQKQTFKKCTNALTGKTKPLC